MSTPREILEQAMSGERRLVMGPLTMVEAIGLMALHDKLLAALRDMVKVPIGAGAQLLQAKLRAHHNAHQVIKLATQGGPVLDTVQAVDYHSVTPICGNCLNRSRQGAPSCCVNGWPVQASGTCNRHVYEPTTAKHIRIGIAA